MDTKEKPFNNSEDTSMRTVTLYQTAKVGTRTKVEVPAGLSAEETLAYLKEHFDELSGGEIEPEYTFDWRMDEELTLQEIKKEVPALPIEKAKEAETNQLPEMCYYYIPTSNEIGLIKRGKSGYYKTEYNCVSDREINEDVVRDLNAALGVSILEKQCMVLGSMFGWDVPGAQKDNYSQDDIKRMESIEHKWEKYLGDYIRNDLEATKYDFDYICVTCEEAHIHPEDLIFLKVVTKEDAAKMWEMKAEDIPAPENRGEGYWKERMKEYVMHDYKFTSVEYVKSALDQASVLEKDRYQIHPELAEKKKRRSCSSKAITI